jgi:hypothetical protein
MRVEKDLSMSSETLPSTLSTLGEKSTPQASQNIDSIA